jgi:hypothetical protein
MWQAALLAVGMLGQNCPECESLFPAPRADVNVRVNSPEVVPIPAPSVESPVEVGTVFVPMYGRCRVVVDLSTGRAFLLKHRNARSEVVPLNGVRVGVYAGSGVHAKYGLRGESGQRVSVKSRGGGRCKVRVLCR